MDYWAVHGFFFLVFLVMFPRITLLVCGIATGQVLWWLGWVFCPHILVAVLATMSYGDTNPLLVGMSWLIALGGTLGEGSAVSQTKSAAK